MASAPTDKLGTVLSNLSAALVAESFVESPILFSAKRIPDTLADGGDVFAIAIDRTKNVNYRGSTEIRLAHTVRVSLMKRHNIHGAVAAWRSFADDVALKAVDALLDIGDDLADYDVIFSEAVYGTDAHGERITADLIFLVSHDMTLGDYL